MSDPAVELRSVHKTYGPAGSEDGQVEAVVDVDLEIASGEFFTLLGPSGCGKTTTLRLIAGFEDPTAGEILIMNRSMNEVPANRRPVNMVFQSYALFPHLSVEDNVAFGLSVRGVARYERTQRVEQALDLVQLAGYQERRPSQLSGGQQQRVALARALVNEPQVLLLDEPLGALDLKLRKAMQLELKGLQAQLGITFVYVTHDQEEALTMSDRIAVMSKGRVLQVGTAREIYQRPASRFVADFIGESNFLRARVEEVGKEEITVRIGDQFVQAARRSNSISVGDEISLAVRPERMELTASGGGVIEGQLEEVVFMGTDTRFIVRLGSGESVTVRLQNSGGGAEYEGEIGRSVGLAWDPQDAWALMD